ncbi:GcrA family cell cycle regulator [Delftia sp. PS-11]|uniref:GcrA family cell cycle regulator n=1 Tax=Delftia sp. PS-11 TaxID=2767222 RepID=UPI00245785F0|nr:GcrA family cell cycle regulator [Delftia sp. PS-11]KAJ8744580.1 hypothetical protein H9T68_11540 [Delftia sp. PS-11]
MTINIKWSDEDRRILREMFAAGSSYVEIAQTLGRSTSSVAGYANYLGLRKPRVKKERVRKTTGKRRLWRQEEEDYIKANYGKKSALEIATQIGRSWQSVCHRAQVLGLANYSKHRPIGSERVNNGLRERKIANTGNLKLDWRRIDVLEWESIHGPVPDGMLLIKERGKPRTVENMQLVPISEFHLLARSLGAPKDVRKLQALKAQFSFTLSKIEKSQNTSDETIRFRRNGLTVQEVEYLSKNYGSLSIAEMAATLGRPAYNVRGFLHRMGILSPKKRFFWDDEKVALLKSLHHSCSNPELAKALGCSLSMVNRKRKELGILVRQKVPSP